MKITNRKKPSRPQVPTTSTPSVNQTSSVGTENKNETKTVSPSKNKLKKEYKAVERLTLKVDPPDLELVKLLSSLENKKNYEMANEMIQFYMNNKLEDRERRIVEKMFNAKYDI